MEKISLYKHSSEDLNIEISTFLDENENLIVQGYDRGEEVKKFLDDYDNEYSLSVPSDSLNLFKKSLGRGLNNSKFLRVLQKRFSGFDSFSRIKQYLDNRKIPYTSQSF
ncbi:MAG: hypothetical protein H7A24_14410 [Leptospiraceae bacterium]|nr:hypothetical protein [Leptospiraceae bacterium]MCP5513075.1 hypothetical protein [Leptospiraceae bacterium]